jgi:NAD(P)-dependent dehydrogenase (short-subunit alcohol dehydrogenase family)
MNVDISRKVVVITGAAQGIGRSLAPGLAREGARIRGQLDAHGPDHPGNRTMTAVTVVEPG